MLKQNDLVMITSHSFFGNTAYVGDGRIQSVRKHEDSIEYIVMCSDGKPRSVSQGDKMFPKDSIMVL